MAIVPPPESIEELISRAEALAGFTLGELAQQHAAKLPPNLLLEKGWVGQFFEQLLGASAGSLPEPDFPHLGVELKTIPVNEQGKPLESTFVSVVYLMNQQHETWETSLVKKKLSRVLWIPVLAPRSLPITERRVGMPLLWQPTPQQEAILRCDWEEAMEKVCMGKLGELNARFGQALQVRPKAANSKVLTEAIGPDGEIIKTLPRGFYLRSSFTQQILSSLSY
jgi:DNA mismatch repair protein MutH